MDNFDLILTDTQYKIINNEYKKISLPQPVEILNLLTSIIHNLEINGFMLPLNLQNKTLNQLLNAKQLLNILYQEKSTNRALINNNPFELLKHLTNVSLKLNSHSLKSFYQTIYLKTNSLILNLIYEISQYFANKTIKIL